MAQPCGVAANRLDFDPFPRSGMVESSASIELAKHVLMAFGVIRAVLAAALLGTVVLIRVLGVSTP